MFPEDLKTLPDTDPLLGAVTNEEAVLRRFDPDNKQVCIVTDEGGTKRTRITGGALVGFSTDGCSVNRRTVMERAIVPIKDMLLPKYRSLAEAEVNAIRGFKFKTDKGAEVLPFEVRPDPYPEPTAESPAMAHQVAHALVVLQVELTRAERTTAVGSLARTVFRHLQVVEESIAPDNEPTSDSVDEPA